VKFVARNVVIHFGNGTTAHRRDVTVVTDPLPIRRSADMGCRASRAGHEPGRATVDGLGNINVSEAGEIREIHEIGSGTTILRNGKNVLIAAAWGIASDWIHFRQKARAVIYRFPQGGPS